MAWASLERRALSMADCARMYSRRLSLSSSITSDTPAAESARAASSASARPVIMRFISARVAREAVISPRVDSPSPAQIPRPLNCARELVRSSGERAASMASLSRFSSPMRRQSLPACTVTSLCPRPSSWALPMSTSISRAPQSSSSSSSQLKSIWSMAIITLSSIFSARSNSTSTNAVCTMTVTTKGPASALLNVLGTRKSGPSSGSMLYSTMAVVLSLYSLASTTSYPGRTCEPAVPLALRRTSRAKWPK
mmetsp:Transcript_12590/g.39717  ORF Transcript_12590/g.39717 Transcript_12590/m.39717 type:complete len:252 (-) Transcript_12590:2904-3659(-)